LNPRKPFKGERESHADERFWSTEGQLLFVHKRNRFGDQKREGVRLSRLICPSDSDAQGGKSNGRGKPRRTCLWSIEDGSRR